MRGSHFQRSEVKDMESLEQELMKMLRQLPIPVTITWRSGLFHWQCAGGNGASPHLVSALEQALRYMLKDLPVDTATAIGKKSND
jgi:hypothetical protein